MKRMFALAAAAALLSTAAMAQSLPTPTVGGAPLPMGQFHANVTPPPVMAAPAPTGGPRTLGTPVAYGSFSGNGAPGISTLNVSPGGGGGGSLPSAKSVGGPVFGKVQQ